MHILVTGGVRSGKSRHAEALLGSEPACFVAAGPSPEAENDPDWSARVASHRARRPDSWVTEETRDVAAVLGCADRPVLVDCLGTWLSSVLDDADAWEQPAGLVTDLVQDHTEALVGALGVFEHDAVLVTNEVGLGVVPEHRSGRLFRDLLGVTNQTIAQACDEVHLVVAGRVLRL